MDRIEPTIFTNMCMISDGAGNVLVEDRRNPNWPGLTFPGGHVELGESFCASVVREVREETGLTIEHPVLCGIKQFPHSGARYIVLFFRADRFFRAPCALQRGRRFLAAPRRTGNPQSCADFRRDAPPFRRRRAKRNVLLQRERRMENRAAVRRIPLPN